MFGRLTWDAFVHDWIELLAGFSMVLGAIALAALLTYTKRWKWLWTEWLTSVDHKKIGMMYIVVSFVMLAKGQFLRSQQMLR